ncbi:MAG: NAD-binding protein [Candidatus Omnitrophica bacterium]|nr:NAD-binding protein [Candidatus Omnitrophota bacterium]MBU1997333.1 NAD-binding protein [Candidatus Omnitrophota bacterium]MBU4332857.1 NAD-binding protein [Candidatus Omnitrophota bacterium]
MKHKEIDESLVRFRIGIGILVAVMILGTVGFYYVEDNISSVLDAFYFTLVTVSTVGYGDIAPVTTAGKILAIILIVAGVGSVFVVVPTFFELIVKKEIEEVLKLPTEKSKITDHIIVCGWGKVGKTLIDELEIRGEKFIVIENNPLRIKHLVDRELLVIEGDACSETILDKANIDKARLLYATLDDASNVFIVLTAKILNPKIKIVSKVDYLNNEAKLMKAGADEIINCHQIGAKKMLDFVVPA